MEQVAKQSPYNVRRRIAAGVLLAPLGIVGSAAAGYAIESAFSARAAAGVEKLDSCLANEQPSSRMVSSELINCLNGSEGAVSASFGFKTIHYGDGPRELAYERQSEVNAAAFETDKALGWGSAIALLTEASLLLSLYPTRIKLPETGQPPLVAVAAEA